MFLRSQNRGSPGIATVVGNSEDTSIGGPRRDFPSTCWTLIRKAGGGLNRESLEQLVYLYWKPAYCYLRAAGRRTVEDAKDLTQDFFTRLVERKNWERLSPEKGSFRGFLKRALKNFLIDASRREQARQPSTRFMFRFDEVRDEPAGPDPENAFDREWVRTVLRDSIGELEDRLRQDGSASVFEVFRLYCLPEGGKSDPGESSRLIRGLDSKDSTYADVAKKLGLRESDVRKRLSRCRSLLREIVLERIRRYAGDDRDVREEFEAILKG
jgi:RNA polymerase sigma factor (sigma-70 family)